MTSSRDAIHPVHRRTRRRSSGGGREKEEVSFWQDFGTYQVCLLAATQISYMPIAASLLSTTFMKTSEEACALVREARNASSATVYAGANETTAWNQPGTNDTPVAWFRPEGEFLSLLSLWDLDCTERSQFVQTTISTMIMVGGLVGAAASGFVADRYGRKPVVIASLVLCSLANGLLLLSSLLPWLATLPIFFLLGGACGGYMTTNLVLVVESLCLPSSRLLVVALNGWSLSMAGTALLAYLCPNWLQYHLALSIIASICGLILFLVADESLRWLKSSHKVKRFDRASTRLVRFNGGEGCKDIALLCQLEKDCAAAPPPPVRPLITMESDEESGNQRAPSPVPSLSYLDLMAERSLRPRLLSLAFCFFSSSIVSFGCYYAIDSLSGNRCANLAIAGGGKFLLGLLPFLVSSCVSRKQVALISVASAAVAVWIVLVCLLIGLPFQSIAITVLSLVATAALDPNWKISHLYSTELFPTSMRNMARGFCNSMARIGSVLSPLISHLRHDIPHVTFGVFAALLTAQFVITALFLPNQPPSELQDVLPSASPSSTATPSERLRRKAKRSEYDEERSRENSSQLSESAPLTP